MLRDRKENEGVEKEVSNEEVQILNVVKSVPKHVTIHH